MLPAALAIWAEIDGSLCLVPTNCWGRAGAESETWTSFGLALKTLITFRCSPADQNLVLDVLHLISIAMLLGVGAVDWRCWLALVVGTDSNFAGTLLLRAAKRSAGMGIYLRVFGYFRPFFWPTFWGLVITLLTTGLNLLTPWPFKIMVDELLPGAAHYRGGVFTEKIEPLLGGPFSVEISVLMLAGAVVLIHVASGLFNLWSNYLFIRVGLQALLRLRTDVYTMLHSLSLKFHDLRRSTDLSFRVAYDSQSLQTFYNRGLTNIFASVVLLVSTFTIMWQMDWKLTATSMAVVPFVV
ncbi:MAG TPA: ABC transporter transmembrane domain-containing protein, partial [Blastocatellia bacterium]|nr:ABC transporter transmembrane domain-containing protein [Blastocatellia bacterium]